MLCSDEAWEIIMILTPAWAVEAKIRAAMPGMPIMPPPSTLIVATLSTDAMPATGPSAGDGVSVMRVPGSPGVCSRRTLIGMRISTAGRSAKGWMIRAPKYESSIASR
jgi:hypothetical protein